MTKLSYEEWKIKNPTTIADGLIEALKILHTINAEEEIEKMIRQEYEFYLLTDEVEV